VMGGYITGSANCIDMIRSYAPAFIFTTTMPPAQAAGALASIRYLMTHDRERKQMHSNVQQLRSLLNNAGLPLLATETHILPLIIGDPVKCKQASTMLMEEFGVYVQPINFPTVPRGTERLRITVSPLHTGEMMHALVTALVKVFTALDISLTSKQIKAA